MKVLITSGGTKVPIDSVRDITNMSKGTFGSAIAEAFLNNGDDVLYLCGSDSKSPFSMTLDFRSTLNHTKMVAKKHEWCEAHHRQYREVRYRNYDDYKRLVFDNISTYEPDVIILAAAVSDYITNPMVGKVRSSNDMTIKLHKAEKIISRVREAAPQAYIVGFKLLVSATDTELLYHSLDSINNNKCDAVVANDLAVLRSGKHRILYVMPYGDHGAMPIEFLADSGNELAVMLVEKVKNEYSARGNGVSSSNFDRQDY